MTRYRKYLQAKDNGCQRGFGIEADFNYSFGFSPEKSVFIQGRGGLMLDHYGRDFIRDRVNRSRPDILILEIGTNDLTDQVHPSTLADNVQNLCSELRRRYSVKYIVLLQVVQRRKTRQCPRAEFDQTRLSYNRRIQHQAQNNRYMYVFRHDRSILVNIKEGEVSKDNIHVTSALGMQLYHFSLRKAIKVAMDGINYRSQ